MDIAVPPIPTLHTREEIWQRFASEIGGTYVPGDFWEEEKIKATISPWNITLALVKDNPQFATTRLTARYVSPDGFTFAIFRVDSHFHVEGTPPEQLTRFLANESLRRYLIGEAHIRLCNESVAHSRTRMELVCTVVGAVGERHRLLALFELMGESLQHLCLIGSAEETVAAL